MNNPRFSIIIPVYNVEKYIRRCMDSIMNQTFRDFEVIVVDDETPDNSMQIVAEFAEKFPEMVTMIHQKNTRLGGARNRGVKDARGEYLLFIDSDDYVSTDMLASVDAQLKQHACDMLIFKYRMVTPEGKGIRDEGFGSLAAGMYFPEKDRQVVMLPVGAVHKVYRRSFYLENGFGFLEGVLYEDAITRYMMAKASAVYLHEAVLYYYVQSPGSIMRQKPSAHVLDILKVTDMVLDAFQKGGIYGDFQAELDASLLTSILHVFNLVNKAEIRSPLQDTFAEFMENRFENFESNPNILRENKKAIRCILDRRYRWYHIRFLMRLEVLETLMGYPPVAVLNRLRKRILRKIRGRK